MSGKKISYLRKLTLSLGLTGFGILLICLLLGWQAITQIVETNSAQSIDEEALALRSKTVEPESSVLSNLSPTAVLIVAGVLATLVIANAVAEASSDSFLGEVKRQFGSVHVEHLFLPVEIETSEHLVSSSYLVGLDKHHATFLATQPLLEGTKVSFHTDFESSQNNSQPPQFHGTVSRSRRDKGSNFFEVQIRLHAKSDAEKHNLTNWITSLRPSALAT